MGGPSLTPAEYRSISDWDVLHVYLAPRDKDGDFITIRDRIQKALGFEPPAEDEPEPEIPDDPFAKINVPREAALMSVPLNYVSMFWSVWRTRGLTDEQIMQQFRAVLRQVPPPGGHETTDALGG